MQKVLTKIFTSSMLVLILLVLFNSVGGCLTVRAAGLSPTIDQIVQQVLFNIRTNGWNPQAQSKGRTVGGLYLNWQMNKPTVTNSGAAPTSHDPQVDLYYLNALDEYKSLHPQDHTYDADIARALLQVETDFVNYNVPKGWLYFYLLRNAAFLQNAILVQEAHVAASNLYNHWYNAHLGYVYNSSHTPGDYAVDHILECGSELVDAGMRWGMPAWVQAGQSTLSNALTVGMNQKYHLFYDSINVPKNGVQTVENYQAKPSTEGMAAQVLVNMYELTHSQYYLSLAGNLLRSMFNSALWDQTYGGLFFALNMSTGILNRAYKETRGQTLVLIALYRYNLVMRQLGELPLFPDKQQQLISLLSNQLYQSTYHGFFYRVTPSFQIYTSAPGQGAGYEDFFTTEAMGTAMDALQQTESSAML